ncbi:MAG: aminomethyl-transferring glycine dehydrogenase subunit GcvPA [Acidimicrobiales bacterium]
MSAAFVPHTDAEIAEMLAFLGLEDLDDLFAEIPEALRLAGGLDLPPAMSEPDVAWRLDDLASRNRPCGRDLVCFAGAGSYDHEIPAVVRSLASRSEFLTAYTPYQPEVSQGVLQAIFEYQTMIARLSGLDVANASLYDGAASLVEAVNLAVVATGRPRVLCSQAVHPHWRQQLETFSHGSGNEIDTVPLSAGVTAWNEVVDGGPFAAVVVAAPNFLGCLEDIGAARAIADRFGARLIVCFDPVSAGLLRPPGELGADVVVGEGQPFGTALGFGGPYLGLFACRLADVRRIPGRIVGETLDREGRHAYVMTLRAREQDIRRERASSNVCTNQTLMAVTAAIQLSWLGPKGLREVALGCARATRYTREALLRIDGVQPLTSAPVLREFAIGTPVAPEKLIERLVEDGFLAGVPIGPGFEGTAYDGGLLVAATEKRTRAEIDDFASAFEKAVR